MKENLYKLENIKSVQREGERFFVLYDGWTTQRIEFVLPVYTGNEGPKGSNISRTLKKVATGEKRVRKQETREVSKEAARKIVELLRENDMISFHIFTRFEDKEETIPDRKFWKIDTKKEKQNV